MQHQTRLSPRYINELTDAYQAGSSVKELVDHYRVHRTTVLAHLERSAIPRRANKRKLSDHDVQLAAQYYRAGESLVAVAQRFRVDGSTILREFRKAGVETRRRRGQAERPFDPV